MSNSRRFGDSDSDEDTGEFVGYLAHARKTSPSKLAVDASHQELDRDTVLQRQRDTARAALERRRMGGGVGRSAAEAKDKGGSRNSTLFSVQCKVAVHAECLWAYLSVVDGADGGALPLELVRAGVREAKPKLEQCIRRTVTKEVQSVPLREALLRKASVPQ